jgi:hypothetical protein
MRNVYGTRVTGWEVVVILKLIKDAKRGSNLFKGKACLVLKEKVVERMKLNNAQVTRHFFFYIRFTM